MGNTRDTHSSVAAILAMSGFDDDFGEMVEPAEVHTDIADLLSSAVKNNDPAAEFLAREQQQLGELEVDIGALAVSPQRSPIIVMEKKIKEEPEVIKEWRERQTELLRLKDEAEENARNNLKDQAATELSGWYEQNAIQLEKLRAANREAMITANKTFVAELEPLEPGTEWDRLDNIFEYFYKFVSGLPSFVILTQKVQKM